MKNHQTAYGIIFHPGFHPQSLPDFARQAEDAGFDELWLWDDCFLPGALTSAAIALSNTHHIKVGIGLLPTPAYNPLFAAMEITTLSCAFPGRIIPGFGHGVGSWMAQIGAAPGSSLKRLEESVASVRDLLAGENVTRNGQEIYLDNVQMRITPDVMPPLYIGAMREKSLKTAGKLADGVIITGMSSPAYLQWAKKQVMAGAQAVGRESPPLVVYLDVKVNSNGQTARAAARKAIVDRLPWADIQLEKSGIPNDMDDFVRKQALDNQGSWLPDTWLDAFSASGTPQQVLAALPAWFKAGASTVIFQPLNGDSNCLDEYCRYLMPVLK